MTPAAKIVIPAKTGKAFEATKGQIVRLTQQAGPQVIDLNAFRKDDPREHFWAGRTRIIEGAHLTEGAYLWTVEPWMRPMLAVVADTTYPTPSSRGAGFHDLWFPRCNGRWYEVFFSEHQHPNCHTNLCDAAASAGIGEELVHDTLNAFMKTGFDSVTGKFFTEPTDSRPTDYLDLRAELDCIIAISACPGFANPKINDAIVEIFDPE